MLEMHLIDVQLGLPDAVPCGPRAVSRRGMTCLGKVAPHLHHGSAAANEKVSGVKCRKERRQRKKCTLVDDDKRNCAA